jgi:epoxyqueuosine reductase
VPVTAEQIKDFARECGFELAGVTAAVPHEHFSRFDQWRNSGMAGEMAYLTDRRGDLRADPRRILPDAKSIVCVGKLYNTNRPYSHQAATPAQGWISRYAWGRQDYHDVMRRGLENLAQRIAEASDEPCSWRICVDTAPLLERSYARASGLGWIGKNTCLINQQHGSWFFLGELLVSIPLTPDAPPPDRCGTCTRCIDACPTSALIPDSGGRATLDARRCISYLTIEKRGPIDQAFHQAMGNHIFGCDICQDVCPWNSHAPFTSEPGFQPSEFAPELENLAQMSAEEFRARFRHTPVWRAKYNGFLRNVAIALANCTSDNCDQPQHAGTMLPK